MWPHAVTQRGQCLTENFKAFSCTNSLRAVGESISKAASIPFVIHVPGTVCSHPPCACVYCLSTWRHHMWPNLPGLLPPYLHTASNQRLEVGGAWEVCSTIPVCTGYLYTATVSVICCCSAGVGFWAILATAICAAAKMLWTTEQLVDCIVGVSVHRADSNCIHLLQAWPFLYFINMND